jgi:glycosyltransferase involved in cell wall biosynthesis
MNDDTTPSMTVVVCTYNRAEVLPTCLRGLTNQTIRSDIQVIVVDDGSSQDVQSVVADFDVEFIALGTNHGLSFARNAGIARSRSPIIAFTDDDVIVPPDWCERLLRAWREAPNETRAIGGEVTVADVTSLNQRYLSRHNPLSPIDVAVAPDASFWQRLRAYVGSDSVRLQPIRHVHSLVGANMSFARQALVDVGEFDPSIRFGGDEEHVCKNVRKRFGDESILCYSSIVVAHAFNPRLRDTLRRAFRYGIASGRTWSRDGGVPSVRPTGGLFIVSLIVAGPFSIAGAVLLALVIPFLMWRRWVSSAWRERNPEALLYPLIALAQELCSNVGFLVGWLAERHRDS